MKEVAVYEQLIDRGIVVMIRRYVDYLNRRIYDVLVLPSILEEGMQRLFGVNRLNKKGGVKKG